MEKACVICGVIFSASRSDAEVCSQKCRQKNWRRRKAFGEVETEEVTFEKQIEDYLHKPENVEYRRSLLSQFMGDLTDFNVGITKEEPGEKPVVVSPLSEEGQKVLELAEKQEIEERIAEIEKELKNPPKNPLIGLSNWIKVRQMEIDKLKKQLQ